MSPTIFKWHGYRFFFFSREEDRIHVHVFCAEGEAKFWLEPKIELAENHHLTATQLKQIENVIQERQHDIIRAWHQHFSGRSHKR